MTEEFLKSFNKHTDTLQREASELKRLALAFATTGNKLVSERLLHIADNLIVAEEDIQDALGIALRKELNEAKSGVTSTFKSMLEFKDYRQPDST